MHWDVIPLDDRNGIITAYNISYRKSDTSDPWQSGSVDAATFFFNATELDNYQFYDFKIAGFTVVGIGPFSNIITIRTDADGKSIMFNVVFLAIFFLYKICTQTTDFRFGILICVMFYN